MTDNIQVQDEEKGNRIRYRHCLDLNLVYQRDFLWRRIRSNSSNSDDDDGYPMDIVNDDIKESSLSATIFDRVSPFFLLV